MDQCKNCTVRVDLDLCEITNCSYHELWYAEALRLRAETADARVKRLEEALREIRDYSAYSHPDEEIIAARDRIIKESINCTACQHAKAAKWPPSGLCEKHYSPVMRAHDKVSAMFDYKQTYAPQDIARKAMEDK